MTDTNPIIRLREDKKSRKKAIEAFCAQCVGCSDTRLEPGFRTMIRECTATGCALHHFRPYQAKSHAYTAAKEQD